MKVVCLNRAVNAKNRRRAGRGTQNQNRNRANHTKVLPLLAYTYALIFVNILYFSYVFVPKEFQNIIN